MCVCICESVYMCMCECRSPKDQPWCMAVTTRNSDAGPFCAGVSAAPHKSLTALLFFLHRLLSSEILTLTRKGSGPQFFCTEDIKDGVVVLVEAKKLVVGVTMSAKVRMC